MSKQLMLFWMLVGLTMAITCDSPNKLSNQFTLSFQYGARFNIPLQDNKATVIWNDVIILSVNPIDYKITNVSLTVYAKKGINSLQFQGNGGQTPHYGITIANVKLTRKGTTQNIVINGQFKQPQTEGFRKPQQILGWKTADSNIQAGNGAGYNPGWAANTKISELDCDSNYVLTQQFNFDCQFNVIPSVNLPIKAILQIDWAYRQNQPPETSQGTILFNGKTIATLTSKFKTIGINFAVLEVQIKLGENKLTFDGNSQSDGYGISIGFVKLSRKGKDQN